MKFYAALACLIVAWDCAEKAAGVQTQSLFAPSAVWAWWIAAGSWVFGAIGCVTLLRHRSYD